MLRWLGRLFGVLFALILLIGAAVAFVFWHFDRPGPLQSETIVEIPRGAGLSAVADRLAEAGVIDQPYLFMAGVMLNGAQGSLRFGEYAFPASVTGFEAMEIVQSGRSVTYPFTVAEGLTSQQIFALLVADERLTGELDAVPPEGTLLPETYSFVRNASRQSLVDQMTAAMDATIEELWPARAEGLPFDTPEEAIVLASIIEKETGVPEERGEVAGVFVNRLNEGMRLQTDPTVIYAITLGRVRLGRALTRADLEVDSPYNTYQVTGLPPGPIANPGRASIEAALNPTETEYLYFVADGTGGHAFARTLDEHNANVAEWRRIQQSQGDN
ncbi:MAG: endolytic transglycosylase MltG [Pseudomonadota bacterium]